MSLIVTLLATAVIGIGGAVQAAMLGAVGRERGAPEAAWLSLLATLLGVALVLGVQAIRGEPPALPRPLGRTDVLAAVVLIATALLLLSVRGLPAYYAASGLFGVAFLIGASALAPRAGLALFLSALIAGQLLGGLALDQWGAFGAEVHRLNLRRALGVALLLAGVVLVRWGDR